MALTEKFTTQELDDFITANPDMAEVINNSKPAKERRGGIRTGIDTDVAAETGLTKAGDEKTHDFVKRALKHYKTASEQAGTQLTERQQKITDLERQLAQGAGDATLKAQYEALVAKETEYKTQVTTLQTQLFEKDVLLDVRDGLRELRYDPTVKDSVRKVLVDNATKTIVGMAKLQKNADSTEQVVYVRDGKTVLDDKGQPADAAYILGDMLKDVLDNGHQGQGGGAGKDGKPVLDDKGNVKVPDARPADVTTKSGVMEWLLSLGVKQGTPAFDAAYTTHSQGLKLK
jgi:hypothetical protein